MNKNVIIRVAPLMGILCIEAAICVLSLYGVTIILGYGTPSFYSILVAGLKAIALIALIGTSVFSLLCPRKPQRPGMSLFPSFLLSCG